MWIGLSILGLKSVLGNWKRRDVRGKKFSPSRILVFEFTRIGDLICATPLLSLLRAAYPRARITLVVYREMAEVPIGIRDTDKVVALDRNKIWSTIRGLWRLRNPGNALVVSHGINPLVAFFFLISRASGYAGYLWTHTFRLLPGLGFQRRRLRKPFGHLVQQRLDIAEALGLDRREAPPVRYQVVHDNVDVGTRSVVREMKERKAAGEFPIVLSPGSRLLSKKWPSSSFLECAKQLLKKRGPFLIVTGGLGDKELATRLKQLSPGRVLDLTNQTNISGFAALIESASLVICNDSAGLHLAAGLRVPCIALFGPVDPGKVAHSFEGYHTTWITGTIPCECGYNVFREPVCSHDRKCLRSIDPVRVAQKALEILRIPR